jgi:hypothetical protein
VITFICVGLAFLVGLAVVVGFMDAAQATAWRRIAAERRQIWEERQRETHSLEHGVDGDVRGSRTRPWGLISGSRLRSRTH